jgi:hypothetical protein
MQWVLLFAAALFSLPAAAGSGQLRPRTARVADETIRGGAIHGRDTLYTWGDTLRIWSIPQLESRILLRKHFSEGGCLVDLDADRQPEFVGHVGPGLGKLVWIRPETKTEQVIDEHIETPDCLEATLFGRRGVLIVHRYTQVRFYERPKREGGAWPYREIYSFYTPSQQAGLLLADVDADGFTDIICGNYWIKSPGKFDLPWRLFAINTYSEAPLSAMSSFASALPEGPLFVAQGHMQDARLAAFTKPGDPKKMWQEQRLDAKLNLMRPHGIALLGPGLLLVGEQNGADSRLLLFRRSESGTYTHEVLAGATEILRVIPLEGRRFLTVGGGNVSLWDR